MTNLEKLAEAGLLEPDQVSDSHKDIINNELSDAEVDGLISAHQKLGGGGSMHEDQPRGSFF